MKKIIKYIYLIILRASIFRILYFMTGNLRKKIFKKNEVHNILLFGLNRIGDNALSLPALRSVRHNFPDSYISIVSNSYVKDILEIDGSVNHILCYKKKNILNKLKVLSFVFRKKWDLAIDLTCDYTFFPALFLFFSRAHFRVGYNIENRGFLFNRTIEWGGSKKHFIERLLDILRSIGLDVKNEILLKIPDELKQKARDFLKGRGLKNSDILIGIHPGGYYPSQRWRIEGFARVAEEVMHKYKARVLIIDNDRELLKRLASLIEDEVIEACNLALAELIGIISLCRLVICNNSGILHLACALDIPTVSTMGPTVSWQWWPLSIKAEHIVLFKNLSCQPCKDNLCQSRECLDLISPEEMLQAIDKQLS